MSKNKKEFSIKQAFNFGWSKFKENAALLMGLFFFVGVIYMLFDSLSNSEDMAKLYLQLIAAVGYAVQIALKMVVVRLSLAIHKGEEVRLQNMFNDMHLFLKFAIAEVFVGLIVVFGFALFVIPGVIAALGFTFVSFIILDKGFGPIGAMKKSWNIFLSVRNKFNFFLFIVLIVALNIFGALLFIIGLVVTLPISSLAVTYVYKQLIQNE